jgi:hypothetical protein
VERHSVSLNWINKNEEQRMSTKLKQCKICGEVKENKGFHGKTCRDCQAIYQKNWRTNNQSYIKKYRKKYAVINSEKLKKDKKEWYELNKEEQLKQANVRSKQRRKNDPVFRFRGNVSSLVYQGLKRRGGSKKGQSFFNKIKYTPKEMLDYLMSYPEKGVWITPNNQGKYDPKTWDDNDPSTWTWQIDHIIPHSTFHYTSMDDEEFHKCWALSNLRPLSAKQNFLDGCTKIRHKKKNNG